MTTASALIKAFVVLTCIVARPAYSCDVCVEFINMDGSLGQAGAHTKQCSVLADAISSFYKQGADSGGFRRPPDFVCLEQGSTHQLVCSTIDAEEDVAPLAEYFWSTGAVFDQYVGDLLGLGPVSCQEIGREAAKQISIASPCLAAAPEHTRAPLVPDCPAPTTSPPPEEGAQTGASSPAPPMLGSSPTQSPQPSPEGEQPTPEPQLELQPQLQPQPQPQELPQPQQQPRPQQAANVSSPVPAPAPAAGSSGGGGGSSGGGVAAAGRQRPPPRKRPPPRRRAGRSPPPRWRLVTEP